MRIADFINAVIKAKPKHQPSAKPESSWIRTMDILPFIGVTSPAGARPILARLVRCGFAKEKRQGQWRLFYQLSPEFKTWGDAHTASLLAERFKAPRGWISLKQYARKHRRTVRGIQYRIDGADIDWSIFKTPRPVPHYRESDLNRILSKAS
jgi:hypothetical protein